jgi:hypothetical protein
MFISSLLVCISIVTNLANSVTMLMDIRFNIIIQSAPRGKHDPPFYTYFT